MPSFSGLGGEREPRGGSCTEKLLVAVQWPTTQGSYAGESGEQGYRCVKIDGESSGFYAYLLKLDTQLGKGESPGDNLVTPGGDYYRAGGSIDLEEV